MKMTKIGFSCKFESTTKNVEKKYPEIRKTNTSEVVRKRVILSTIYKVLPRRRLNPT